MDIQRLTHLIQKDSQPDKADLSWLQSLVNGYPYFQTTIFLYLKAVFLYTNEKFDEELERLSVKVNDRRALFYYIYDKEYEYFLRQTDKTKNGGDKTSSLLDAYFESMGESESLETLEYSISHSSLATTDYFSYLQAMPAAESNEENKQDNVKLAYQGIIDSFITKSEIEGGIRIHPDNREGVSEENYHPVFDTQDDELNEDVFFTETLAKIYIKQKKYEKAHKIIKHLSLNYPKKNTYFADQINFLEKLIINSKHKDTK
ncbi:MAG: hypothetical protein LBV43_10625 [Prevotella sp.]|nr:hypothetical protein [Prevotella sp.]